MKRALIVIILIIHSLALFSQIGKPMKFIPEYWKSEKYYSGKIDEVCIYNENGRIETYIEYRYNWEDYENVYLLDSVRWDDFYDNHGICIGTYGTYFTYLNQYNFDSNTVKTYEISRGGISEYNKELSLIFDSLIQIHGGETSYEIKESSQIIKTNYRIAVSVKSGIQYKIPWEIKTYTKDGDIFTYKNDTCNTTRTYLETSNDTIIETHMIYMQQFGYTLIDKLYYVNNLLLKITYAKTDGMHLEYPTPDLELKEKDKSIYYYYFRE